MKWPRNVGVFVSCELMSMEDGVDNGYEGGSDGGGGCSDIIQFTNIVRLTPKRHV